MWIIDHLPQWVFSLLFFSSVIAYLLSTFIPIATHKQVVRAVSVIVIALSVYCTGALHGRAEMNAKIAELEAKVQLAEEKSKALNVALDATIKSKTKYIKEVIYANTSTLKEGAGKQLDANCTLPVSSIVLHDASAQAQVARGPGLADGSPSGVAPSKLLETVIENYGSCHENAEKLRAWQEWYAKQKKIYEEIK